MPVFHVFPIPMHEGKQSSVKSVAIIYGSSLDTVCPHSISQFRYLLCLVPPECSMHIRPMVPKCWDQLTLFTCWFQSGLFNQPTVLFSQKNQQQHQPAYRVVCSTKDSMHIRPLGAEDLHAVQKIVQQQPAGSASPFLERLWAIQLFKRQAEESKTYPRSDMHTTCA